MAWLARKPVTPEEATATLHRLLVKSKLSLSQVKIWLDAGADINGLDSKDYTILHRAMLYQPQEIVAYLLDRLEQSNTAVLNMDSVFLQGVLRSNTQLVERLIKRGALDGKDTTEKTKLLVEAISHKCSADMMQTLIKAGADVDANDGTSDYTPLHLAVTKNYPEGVKVLLEAGAEPNPRSHQCYPPLHLAASCGYIECARALLRAGAAVNRRENGDRPLHMAAQGNHDQMIVLLCEHGADPELENEIGFTAMAVASLWGQSDAQSMLLEYGARITKDLRNFKALEAQFKKARKVWDDWKAEGCDPEALTTDHIRNFAIAGMFEQLTKQTFWRGREEQLSRLLNDLPKHLANRLSAAVLDVMHGIAAPTTTITGWDATIDLTPQEVIWRR